MNKILQDRIGYIWIGTDRGLFKFDGTSYRRFLGIDNLPDENVTALAEDSVGRIWAGFKNGKISFFEKNVFTPFEPPEGMPKLPISDILFDKDGVLWFSTLNDGTYYQINNRLYRLDDINGMPDLFCYDLEQDSNGNIWIGTDGGVAICKRDGNSSEIKTLNNASGLPDNIVKKVVRGKGSEMYLATEDAGVVKYDTVAKKFDIISNQKWSFGSTADMLLTNDWIWVATSKGLLTIDLNGNRETKTQSSDVATALMQDAEGNIWIGSKMSLKRTLGNQLQFIETEGSENIIAVAADKDGSVWFSDGKTLFRRAASGALSKPLVGTLFASKSVISLYADEEGAVWAGLYGEGVLCIAGSVKLFAKELRNGNVLNITGNNKKIWLSTLGGASEIDTKDFSIKNYSTDNGLSTDYIYQVFVDSKDRAWFATDRNGADMLDEKGFHHFEENFDSKVVYGFTEDAQQHVWANVQGSGLLVFDEQKFQPFGDQIRLHSSSNSILCSTDSGKLVAVHDLGIDIFDPVKKKFRYLGEQSGLENKIPNLNAVAKSNRDQLFIGTDNGLIVYSPSTSRQDSPKPMIGQVKVNDAAFELTVSDQLTYDQNNIKIDFTGLWFQNPGALRYNYLLENYDQDWISTGDNSVTYSRLPPGDYTFKLKVSDSDDFYSSPEASIHFVIQPPFWRTNLFYLLVAAVVAVSSYFFIYLREKQLLADKRELEIKVRERTVEIEQKSHEIQAQAEEIKGINENLEELVKARTVELERKSKALADYAFINAHELRAPVASILGLIHLMQKLDLNDDEKVYLSHLKDSAKKLDSVVSSITEAIERGDFTLPS